MKIAEAVALRRPCPARAYARKFFQSLPRGEVFTVAELKDEYPAASRIDFAHARRWAEVVAHRHVRYGVIFWGSKPAIEAFKKADR